MINVNGREIETDAEGYLATLDDWSEDVAKCLAERDELALADEHWQVVRWIREYYAENGTAPNLRVAIDCQEVKNIEHCEIYPCRSCC
jgi:tRNA 2-thiouridine synthesizing protein E